MKPISVGIYGKKGSGRKTAAWLLAKTIEEIIKGTPIDKYRIKFKCWKDLVIYDKNEAKSTDHVILDSFGEYIVDSVASLVCPIQLVREADPENLDKYFISPITFNVVKCDMCDRALNSTMEAWVALKNPNPAVMVPLEDFIIYFADTVIRGAFGANFWTTSLKHSRIQSDDIRIYWDVKTTAEQDFCDYIVNVQSPDREDKKKKGWSRISGPDPDYFLITTDGLNDDADQFWNVANELYNKAK